MATRKQCREVPLALVVEANDLDATLLCDYLTSVPMDHLRVKCLGEARHALEDNLVDLILLDISLPDAFGFEVIEKVNECASGSPVVVLWNPIDELTKAQSIRHGAQACLDKAKLDDLTFYRTVFTVLEQHRCHQQFRWLLDLSPDALVVTDDQGNVIHENTLASLLLSHYREDPSRLPWDLMLGIDDPVQVKFPSGRTAEIRATDIQWLGRVARLTVLRDVTAYQQIPLSMRQEGPGGGISPFIDSQTRLLNRQGLEHALSVLVEQSRANRSNVAVLLITISGPVEPEQELGLGIHEAIVRVVAARLLSEIRQSDVAGRVGADELLVILPDANIAEAERVAGRLQLAVEEKPLELTSGTFRARVRVGISYYPQDGASLDDLIEKASRLDNKG